jgi:hypothetical protein
LGNCKFGKTFDAGFARRIMAFVHSGFSASARFFIKIPFFPASPSQTDNANTGSANCKNQRVQTLSDHSKPSRLAIIRAVIGYDQSFHLVEIQDGIETNAMLAPVRGRLGGVPFIRHFILLLQFALKNHPRWMAP